MRPSNVLMVASYYVISPPDSLEWFRAVSVGEQEQSGACAAYPILQYFMQSCPQLPNAIRSNLGSIF